MARTLAPHGTPAAYARHLRHGESACAECLKAVREARSTTRSSVRAAEVKALRLAIADAPLIDAELDVLEETRDSLRLVKEAVRKCKPVELPALSKEWERLAARITELQKQRAPDLITALQERRAARIQSQ